jgi:RimJ/RimL family protein N-acetyltransferase
MSRPWPLETERLSIRALTSCDLDDHARLFGDATVVRYLYDERLEGPALTSHLERRLAAAWPPDERWLNLAVDHEGEFLGEVGICRTSVVHRQVEIGYVFGPWARGAGFATEAATAMVELAFRDLGAHRVSGRLDVRNLESAAVLERIGMRREAHLRQNEFVKGEWVDEVIYAVLADEWRSR